MYNDVNKINRMQSMIGIMRKKNVKSELILWIKQIIGSIVHL